MTKGNSVISRSSGQPTMSSREIAKLTGKRHDNVVADILKMLDELGMHAPDFSGTYKTTRGNTYIEYHLHRELTDTLITGYSIPLRHKVIQRWHALEAKQATLDEAQAARQSARLEAPLLTDAIKLSLLAAGKEAKHYHFSNEFNMINRLVLGCTSRQFRKEHGLSASAPVRDALTPWEVKAVEHLQRINTALLDVGMPYAERKARLEQVLKDRYMQAMNDELMRLEA